jgi:Tfp pilus assembly protein PilX
MGHVSGAVDSSLRFTPHVSRSWAPKLASERRRLASEQGVALLTVLLLMVILTMIGIATITVTGLENRMAGNVRTSESGTSAAEACVGTAVNIIQQTIDAAQLPAAFLNNANPAGPVPQGNSATLQAEIMGQSDNNADTADSNPNTSVLVNNFTVNGDIDRLYAVPKSGGSLQFAAGYEGTAGGAAGGGVDILYRIDCVATNAATNTRSRITAIYACTVTGESCQKKL